MNPGLPEAVIFDLDGTLIDSIGIYFRILDTAFDRMGWPRAHPDRVADAARSGEFDWEQVIPKASARDTETMIDQVQKHVWAVYPEMLKKELRLIPGAAVVLHTLSGKGIKTGIVTSTPADAMPHKVRPLKEAGVDGLFSAIITAGDVPLKKPHAQPLIACARRLGAAPHQSLYVGDSVVDIRAGRAARMHTVGVLTGFDDREMLLHEGADAVLPSIRELPEVLWPHAPEVSF